MKRIRDFGRYVVDSPTLMTWCSLLIRSGTVIFILPLVLLKFSVIEIGLWFIFGILIRIRDVLDFGMLNNIARSIAYAYAGKNEIDGLGTVNKTNTPNIRLIQSIVTASSYLYNRSLVISAIILLILGVATVSNTLAKSPAPLNVEYWYALMVHVLGCLIFLWGNNFVAFLTGINKIAILKRWDAIFGALTILSLGGALALGSSFLIFIILMNFWVALTVIRNFYLYRIYQNNLFLNEASFIDKKVVKNIISLSKRDFLGALFGVGFMQGINIFIASVFPINVVNSYLLIDRLIEQIKGISRAPFYTKMPLFAKLITLGNTATLIEVAKKSMLISYVVCFLGFTFVYVFGNELLKFIGINNVVIDKELWLLLCLAAVIDRYTAMHNQIFLIIFNKVITHITLFVTMFLSIVLMLLLYDFIGIYTIPVAYILSSLLFSSWYISYKNFIYLKIDFFSFETKNLIALFIWCITIFTLTNLLKIN